MSTFKILGGKSLKGEVKPQGAKNEALQILCAVLLTEEETTIQNVPDIKDVNLLIDLLKGMGVSVEKTRLMAFIAASLLAGSAASVAGLVGFIGLVVPHLVRLILGGNKWLIPISALGGSALLLWSDIIAKLTFAPAEMPVGVVTGLIGGPYFVFLLYKTKWLR